MIALLGKPNAPADGVEDYCTFLSQALAARGKSLELVRVEWERNGWAKALRDLRKECAGWRQKWALLQYTALAWSRRGFPLGALAVLEVLRRAEVRCAVVFHEPFGLDGLRPIDHLRGAFQNWVIQKIHARAAKSILTAPLESIPWLSAGDSKAVFIPIGANIPEPPPAVNRAVAQNGATRTIAVFCLDGPPYRRPRLEEIAFAVRSAQRNGERSSVRFIGKGTEEAKRDIEQVFGQAGVEVENFGLCSSGKVAQLLAESDVMVSNRGPLYTRRGSAIAGVACGLPIVGYGDAAKIFPLGEAGVQLVPYGDRQALAGALSRVLHDSTLREELREKSRRAQEKFFSWNVIAARLVEALEEAPEGR